MADQDIIRAYQSGVTVEQICQRFGICYYKLYSILHRSGTELRTPARRTIWVLDPDSPQGDPTEVDRTSATLAMRSRQVQNAYYVQQDLVTSICRLFHISWRTLYRICPPNRRSFSTSQEPTELYQQDSRER